MKNLFKKIFETQPPSNQTNSNNSFDLILEKECDTPKVRIDINDTSDEAAERFAKAMVCLNCGIYYTDIMDLIYELSQRGENYRKFCISLSLHLSNNIKAIEQLKEEKQSTNPPLIKPSSFSGK